MGQLQEHRILAYPQLQRSFPEVGSESFSELQSYSPGTHDHEMAWMQWY